VHFTERPQDIGPTEASTAPVSATGPTRRPLKPVLIGAVSALLVLLVAAVWLSWSLPLSRALEPLPDPAVVLLTREGQPFARRGAYKEAPVEVEALPPHVPKAFLAIEDRRFYRHPGIDLRGVARAGIANLRAGRVVQGGSTITQQLAKTTFLKPDRSLRRKAQELLIAFWLELRLTKEEILERYLSSVYFGQGVYGLGAASRHYFDRPPERLTIGQAALLAGVVKAPSAGNPIAHPRKAAARGDLVLDAMVETGAISPAQAKAAHGAKAHPGRRVLPVGGYFADWAEPQVRSAFDAGYGEVEVLTTLDARLQRRAERTVRRILAQEGAARGAGQAALVAMRTDGSVIAMVGGRDYKTSQFNRVVQARRQPGSAFKLFVYLAALRDGADPDMFVSQDPITVDGWTPRNFDRTTGGDLTLRDAFARSSNIAAVRVAETAGRPAVIKAARDLGVRSPIPGDATLSLGTGEITLAELAAAYACVASGQAPVTPHGLPLPETKTPRLRDLPRRERENLLDLLHAAVAEGTGSQARLPQAVFGKTGTSQDYRDAVFVGFTGDIVTAVWVGNDDRSPMKDVTGGGLPARIWREFMRGAIAAGEIPRGPPENARPPPSDGRRLEDTIRRLLRVLSGD
jgi:penicillin-binding protein 1A